MKFLMLDSFPFVLALLDLTLLYALYHATAVLSC